MLSFQKFTRAFWNESLHGDLVGTSGGPRAHHGAQAGAAARAAGTGRRAVGPGAARLPGRRFQSRTVLPRRNFFLLPNLTSLLNFQTIHCNQLRQHLQAAVS